MRLRDVLRTLEGVLPYLESPNGQGIGSGTTHYIRVSNPNRQNLTKVLELLKKVPGFSEYVQQLESLQVVSLPHPEWDLTSDQWSSFLIALKNLEVAVKLLTAVLKGALPPADPDTVSIKLPPMARLSDLGSLATELQTVIDQGLSVYGQATEPAKLTAFDTGTSWLEVWFASLSLKTFAGLVWAGFNLAKKRRELQFVDLHLNALTEHNEAVSVVRQLFTAQVRRLAELEAAPITPESASHEEKQRLYVSIEKLSDLMLRGMEFYPAIPTTETKELFPPSKQFKELQSTEMLKLTAGDKKE